MSYNVLGVTSTHTYSASDITGRCPKCFTNNVNIIGNIHVDGTPHQTVKCNNCNSVTATVDGSIRSLVEEAQKVYQTENVGFTLTNGNGTITSSTISNGSNEISVDMHQVTNKIQDSNYKLDSINSTISNVNYSVQSVERSIDSLVNTIKNLVQQNNQLMEKLATDPLNGVRKMISEFNLK